MVTNYQIRQLAKLFDNPEEAEKLVRASLVNDDIVTNGEKICDFQTFYRNHLSAWEKRLKHKTPHKLNILKGSLFLDRRSVGAGGRRARSNGLEWSDKQRTEPVWVYRPKSR